MLCTCQTDWKCWHVHFFAEKNITSGGLKKRSPINLQLLMWMTNGCRSWWKGLSLKPKNENKTVRLSFVNPILLEAEVEPFFFFYSFNQSTGFLNQQQIECLMFPPWRGLRGVMMDGYIKQPHPQKNLQLKFKPVFIPKTNIKRLKKHKNSQHEKSFWLTSGRAGSVRGRPLGQADGWVWCMLSTCATQK